MLWRAPRLGRSLGHVLRRATPWASRHCLSAPEDAVGAEIIDVRAVTPTIRELQLRLEAEVKFKAGNWVDFFIDQDGVTAVGGYSMCSIPSELPLLRLAVKRSRHPPAAWCHAEARPGKRVKLRPGGTFGFDPTVEGLGLRNLVLVAGGIGINPLYAILQEALHHSKSLPSLERVSLLYSAAVPSELAFREHLLQLAAADPRVHLDLRATRSSAEPWDGRVGRITAEDVAAAVRGGSAGSLVYLCGPPAMTDGLVARLGPSGLNLSAEVKYEKWW